LAHDAQICFDSGSHGFRNDATRIKVEMKLLFAIKGLHQAAGGAERVISDVCSYLADQRGHDVSLLTFDRPGVVPFYPLSRKVRLMQLGIGDARAPTSMRMLLRRIHALRQAAGSEAPDVVVAFMHSMFIPMSFALAGTRIPLVASEHIVRDYYRSRRLQFSLFAAAMPFISRITVLSESIAREYPRWINRKMISVTNPISPSFQKKVEPSQQEDTCRILSIGRFSERKGHATLLAAFASLADEFPGWSLRILGEGVLRPVLMRELRRLGLQDRVSLPGAVSNVAQELADASFFALGSKYESFGLVFAEAMACGKASVAFSDCQGVSDVIDDGETGLLVRGLDPVKSMADGLRRLMTNARQRKEMGQLAKERVFTRYSIELVCDRWENILHDTRRRPCQSCREA
jgi:glycosyltransferase involved in cell wall biosynthesis